MANTYPTEKTKNDHINQGLRSVLAAVPIMGGAAVELFKSVIEDPLTQRQINWLNDIAEALENLEIDVKNLKDNTAFISTLLHASHIAIRNHQQEKLEALRNAVLNSTELYSLEDSKHEMFLGFVDVFTANHLRVLREIQEYSKTKPRAETTVDGLATIAIRQIPHLEKEKDMVSIIITDLCQRELLAWNHNSLKIISEGKEQVTKLGKEFMAFISEPQSPIVSPSI